MVAARDGTHRRRLSRASADAQWGSNGQIAFIRVDRRSGESSIYAINSTGGRATRISRGDDLDPNWSPDGRRIAFSRGLEDSSIIVAKANGRSPRVVKRNASRPVWSADGRMIAFRAAGGLAVMRPDGSGERVLVSAASVGEEVLYPLDWQARRR